MANRRLLNVLGLMVVLLAIMPALTTSSAGWWTQPTNLSDWQLYMFPPWLRIGQDGTQVACWRTTHPTNPGLAALLTRVRPPGGRWSAIEDVTGWTEWSNPENWELAVAPEGTVWMVWTLTDPVPSTQMKVKAARRLPDGTWQSEDLSSWVDGVQSLDLSISPNGDLTAVWVACDSGVGPCAVNARRRPVGATAWESTQQLNGLFGQDEVQSVYALAGPDGLTVVVWDEEDPGNTSQWGVMANTYTSSTGTWDVQQTQVSGFVQPRTVGYPLYWLAQPVMDPAGTVTTAWTARYGPDPNKDAQYSAIRAASSGSWSAPAQISAANNAYSFDLPRLAVGQNGAVAAAWGWRNPGIQWAIYANARDPGGTWVGETAVSTQFVNSVSVEDVAVWPDGTAAVMWEEEDTARPANADEGVFWSARPPSGNWGDGGGGQLGIWYDEVNGAALELSSDGSGTALWAMTDATQAADQQGAVLAAIWPPGGPWDAPTTLVDGYKGTGLWHQGLAARPGGRQVEATWRVERVVVAAPVTTPWAVFYSERSTDVHLPTVMRRSP